MSEHAALAAWLAGALGASRVEVLAVEPLRGGAIQDNRLARLSADGAPREVVLRGDAPATIASSHGGREEFALLRAAHAAGVRVPEPLGFCDDPAVPGAPFAAMAKAEGVGFGPRVAKDEGLGGDRAALVRELGRQLALVHAIRPPRGDLAFLGEPPADAARHEVARMRATLDALGLVRPALEWGLRWAEACAPDPVPPVLCHRDFRTGNYMVDASGLTAVLDWEFAGWGDPMSDLGWFCAACWRFGRPDREAGGVGARVDLYAGYEAEAGAGAVDDARVRYWEVAAHLRWAVVALEQGARHLSGAQPSLELALTARIAPELELAALRATAPAAWGDARRAG